MQDALKQHHQCNHRTEVIACRHIAENNSPVEVLLVAEGGQLKEPD